MSLRILSFASILFALGTAPMYASQNLPAETKPAAAASPSPATKTKKVWTNDDLEDLRNNRGVSVVGSEAKAEAVVSQPVDPAPAQYVREKDPAWYRDQLYPLRERIIEIDGQIRDLSKYRSASAYMVDRFVVPQLAGLPLNPDADIKSLTRERETITRKIGALEDLARHNEILPGDIR